MVQNGLKSCIPDHFSREIVLDWFRNLAVILCWDTLMDVAENCKFGNCLSLFILLYYFNFNFIFLSSTIGRTIPETPRRLVNGFVLWRFFFRKNFKLGLRSKPNLIFSGKNHIQMTEPFCGSEREDRYEPRRACRYEPRRRCEPPRTSRSELGGHVGASVIVVTSPVEPVGSSPIVDASGCR